MSHVNLSAVLHGINDLRMVRIRLRFPIQLKDKYPNFEVWLKCILTVNPYLLNCVFLYKMKKAM